MNLLSECLTGGTAACGACLFTNPLDVVKTRMQLQGELQARGSYKVHYRNVFHAFYMIAKVDGPLALQRGLVPALGFQFVLNGLRLGSYQVFISMGLTKDAQGNISYPKSMLAGATSGCIGSFFGSPAYLLKTQLQSQSESSIAVGTQHNIKSLPNAVKAIYQKHGISGLWRGYPASIARVTVGSAVQLSSYSKAKDIIIQKQFFSDGSIMISIASSMFAAVFVVVAITPFDVVTTRLYNQSVDRFGRGRLYDHIGDVFIKIFKKEGLFAFYKGIGAQYFRSGPHTILSLVFWDNLRQFVTK